MNTIGIDIGGTKMCGIIWDGEKIKKEIVVPTPHNLIAFKHRLLTLTKQLCENGKILPVGIGVAGLVSKKTGVVKSSPNLLFLKNFNIKKFLISSGFSKVEVDNDTACFTLAELKLGQGKKYKNFLCLTLGTGIGGGIVINGETYRGVENFGAEFGGIFVNGGKVEPLFQNARQKKEYSKIGILVGETCVSLINIFYPKAIIFGGSVSNSFNVFKKDIVKVFKENLNSDKAKIPLVVSKIKNAGAVGSALLVE
jgi:glucokinase